MLFFSETLLRHLEFNETLLRHLLRFILTYFDLLTKREKSPQTLENIGFVGILFSERAGIRTPDNLIKSQVLYHLSYTPLLNNWASWIRTNECRSQSPVPYRLAIAQ